MPFKVGRPAKDGSFQDRNILCPVSTARGQGFHVALLLVRVLSLKRILQMPTNNNHLKNMVISGDGNERERNGRNALCCCCPLQLTPSNVGGKNWKLNHPVLKTFWSSNPASVQVGPLAQLLLLHFSVPTP